MNDNVIRYEVKKSKMRDIKFRLSDMLREKLRWGKLASRLRSLMMTKKRKID